MFPTGEIKTISPPYEFPFMNFTASFNNLFDKLLVVSALFGTVRALSHLPTIVSHIQLLVLIIIDVYLFFQTLGLAVKDDICVHGFLHRVGGV